MLEVAAIDVFVVTVPSQERKGSFFMEKPDRPKKVLYCLTIDPVSVYFSTPLLLAEKLPVVSLAGRAVIYPLL